MIATKLQLKMNKLTVVTLYKALSIIFTSLLLSSYGAILPSVAQIDSNSPAAELIGQWEGADGNNTIEFFEDGSFNFVNGHAELLIPGKYTINGNIIRMITKKVDQSCKFSFSTDFADSRVLELPGCQNLRGSRSGNWYR